MFVYELVIHLTQQCPLRCSHCCVESEIAKKVHLDLDLALRAIDEAAEIPTMRIVSFVGGEPFLLQEALCRGVAYASAKQLLTSTVTSAFWAKGINRARQALRPLAEAGLTRISLSYDDPHAEFVGEGNIVHAYRAARELGLHVLVPVAVEPGSRITARYMQRLLGIGDADANFVRVYETEVNSTGRAKTEAAESRLAARRRHDCAYRGPCKSVLRQVSVLPDGAITPCCGVIPYHEGLQIGNIRDTSLGEALERASQNPLLRWIAFEGPVSVLKQATAETDEPLSGEDFDGICQACDILFSNPRYMQLVAKAIPGKEPQLAVQDAIYSGLGVGLATKT